MLSHAPWVHGPQVDGLSFADVLYSADLPANNGGYQLRVDTEYTTATSSLVLLKLFNEYPSKLAE